MLENKQTIHINYLPPTLNDKENFSRTHKFLAAKEKKKHTNNIALICNSQKIKKFNKYPVYQNIEFNVSNFGRDWDNLVGSMKYINDGLIVAKIIKNDNLNHLLVNEIKFLKCKKGKEHIKIELFN